MGHQHEVWNQKSKYEEKKDLFCKTSVRTDTMPDISSTAARESKN
jgi:hypothetical protein